MKCIRNLLILCLTIISCRGETIEVPFRILDRETGKPVEFPHVVLKHASLGVIASQEGIASFRIDSAHDPDTVKVSCIGYETVVNVVRLPPMSGDTIRIFMEPKSIVLEEVQARPARKSKILTLGKGGPGGMAVVPLIPQARKGLCFVWKTGKPGKRTWLTETGIYSETDSMPDIMDKNTILHPVKRIRFRVNIYDAAGSKVKDSWMHLPQPEPVKSFIIEYDIDKVKDHAFSHVFSEPVLLPETALIEFEFLEEFNDGETFIYSNNLFGKSFFIRYVGRYENAWVKARFAMPFFLKCLQESF